MEFINSWLDEESGNMRKFLELVSGPPPEDWIHGLETQGGGARPGQLGRHLSSLHTVLVENVGKVRLTEKESRKYSYLEHSLQNVLSPTGLE